MPLSKEAQDRIIALLWDSLKQVNAPDYQDRRVTGWGTKTKVGLVACLERIIDEDRLAAMRAEKN